MSEIAKLLDAVKAGDVVAVGKLLDAAPGLAKARGANGESPVLLAVYCGQKGALDLLLARGAELNIYEAAALGKAERVAALLEASPGLAQSYAPDGFTPLGLAAFFGHRKVVDLLLTQGADVNAVSRNATGYTALTGAVVGNHIEIVAALLAAGANAAYRYGPGYTPLHEAAAGGKTHIARLLLKHGADPSARTDEGKTPLALALEKGRAEVAALLRQRGAAS